MIQAMIPPMKRMAPPAIAHWIALTTRGEGVRRSLTSPPSPGLSRHRLSRVGEVRDDPFLHLLDAALPPLSDLPDGDDREELGEQEVEESKEGEAPGRLSPFHP